MRISMNFWNLKILLFLLTWNTENVYSTKKNDNFMCEKNSEANFINSLIFYCWFYRISYLKHWEKTWKSNTLNNIRYETITKDMKKKFVIFLDPFAQVLLLQFLFESVCLSTILLNFLGYFAFLFAVDYMFCSFRRSGNNNNFNFFFSNGEFECHLFK